MSLTYLHIRLESTANKREHWAKKAKRAKAHRFATITVPAHPLPCVVTITRIAPRTLDDDNLAISAKSLRDGIADRLGVDDRDPRVAWRYGQRQGKSKEYAVEVAITPA